MNVRRTLLPALCAAAVLLGAAGTAAADEALDSAPPGLRVALEGPVALGGMAPLPLEAVPPGRYRLQVGGAGFPETRGTLLRGADGRISLEAYEGPTALFFPPGVSHLRHGERGRGYVFAGAALAGLGTTLIQELDRHDAAEAYRRAGDRYESAVAWEDVIEARNDLLAAHDAASDAEEVRNLWGMLSGAIWVGSAVELWLLTPGPQLSGSEGRYVVGTGHASSGGAALRSLLVPGAGHRYLGHEGRGNRFAAGIVVAAAASLFAHERYLEARRDQDDAQRRYEAALGRTDAELWRGRLLDAADRADTRNRVQWALAGTAALLHVWNVVDAARLVGTDASVPAWSWSVSPRADGLRAGLSWRID